MNLIELERQAIVDELLREPDVSPWFYGNSPAEAFAKLDAWRAGFLIPNGTCWDILQITPTSDPSVIKRAYRTLAKEAHPDLGGSAELFIKLNEAFAAAMQHCS